MRALSSILWAAGVSTVSVLPLQSQGKESDVQAPGTCDRSASVVRISVRQRQMQSTGIDDNDDDRRCKERARSIVTLVASTRSEQNLQVLTQAYQQVDLWRDSEVMKAAAQIARDAGAAVQARVFAVKHLLWLLQPGAVYSYEILATGAVVSQKADRTQLVPGCRHGFASETSDVVGTPLPPDYAAQLRILLSQLAADTLAPVPVRNAAECGETG